MIKALSIIIFVISIALSAGGIMLASNLRSRYKTDFLTSLLFFEVFYFTFGFYAIWGQVIVKLILEELFSSEITLVITDIILLLGLPFLLFATLMFIRFCRELSGRKINTLFTLGYVMINLLLIAAFGFVYLKFKMANSFIIIKYYFLGLTLATYLAGTAHLLFFQRKIRYLQGHQVQTLLLLHLAGFVVQAFLLLLFERLIWLGPAFVFAYFLTGVILPVYLRYFARFSREDSGMHSSDGFFKHYCEMHGITPRETEIIHEICNGLTNQQIADKLFISLQTVKDHTSRIYVKTDCKNRMQLIRRVGQNK